MIAAKMFFSSSSKHVNWRERNVERTREMTTKKIKNKYSKVEVKGKRGDRRGNIFDGSSMDRKNVSMKQKLTKTMPAGRQKYKSQQNSSKM